MRVSAILSTLLISSVLAAPAPRPNDDSDVQEASSFTVEGRSIPERREETTANGDVLPGPVAEDLIEIMRTYTNNLDLLIKRSTEDLSGDITSILQSLHLPLPAVSSATKKHRRSAEDDWSGDITSILQSLHLPIPAAKGGKSKRSADQDWSGDITSILQSLHLPLPAAGKSGLKDKRSAETDFSGDITSILQSLHLPLPASTHAGSKEKRSTEDDLSGDITAILQSLHLPLPAAKSAGTKN